MHPKAARSAVTQRKTARSAVTQRGSDMTSPDAFPREMAGVVVEALNLEEAPDAVDVDASLFGDDGLGLDSIDILELALVVSKKYGLELRADDPDNMQIFASIRALANHVQLHRPASLPA
jgi:acyl carrier protein